ncbi:MAG: MMPL family transporter [Planctomycetes bacterium]|nr:MMPL family transporter [Planctomycetota bacterium]
MFRRLGNGVARFWPLLLVGWIGALVALKATAPDWSEVVSDGEFTFLPPDAPSRVSERVFQQAWGHPLASSVAIVVRRESHEGGLTQEDKEFIDEVLKPRLEEIVEEFVRKVLQHPKRGRAEQRASRERQQAEEGEQAESSAEPPAPFEPHVRTFSDKSIGRLLISDDNKATLVIVELTTDFMDARNARLIERIEQLTSPDGELHRQRLVPPGLHLDISGSATVGRDMIRAAKESADATELWTILLVIALLVLIYRSPLLAIIPLLTVFIAVETALAVLAHLAAFGIVELFRGIQIYTTVLSYGAGVDYCLFLISRYKEELDEGADASRAVANALAKVGAALTASAGTVICGIGMMSFAEFGKFRQAGHAISLGLFFVLLAALFFAPAVLRLAGRWAFWPYVTSERLARTAGWISAASPIGRLLDRDIAQVFWERASDIVRRKPATVLGVSVALMLPFALIAAIFFHHLSYGLLSELPQDFASVQGAQAVQKHFPAGMAGEITILLKHPELDFSSKEGTELVRRLSDELMNRRADLRLADVRSIARPLGSKTEHQEKAAEDTDSRRRRAAHLIAERIRRKRIADYYVATNEPLKGHVTRVDIVLQDDPFSRDSIRQFEQVVETVRGLLPPEIQVYAIGPTADIRDLKTVTDRDQIRIDTLVLIVVFLILVVLLRKVAVSLYLILSVFFSYMATLGVTFFVFWAMDPSGFAGLDWKVPMFLFTILIAVGEDYNIFLMTRIDEEQRRHGVVEGIIVALRKTGSIISSCGIIMAGTFSSLIAGSLRGMDQLGFALAFGVLLDTFVVRPILVPAYLVLLHSGRLGFLGRFLGAHRPEEASVSESVEA